MGRQAKRKQGNHTYKHLKQVLLNFDGSTQPNLQEGPVFNRELGAYMSIDSGISVRLQAKYCDFTGFFAKYKHRVNGLRYTEEGHFQMIEKMQNNKVEEYLQQRKATAFVK